MSVPKSERAISSMLYIEQARVLARDLHNMANRLPKRRAYRLANPLAETATSLLSHVQAAHRVYIDTGYDLRERRAHLREALNCTDTIEALLTIWFDTTEGASENVLIDYADRLGKERSLIKGVMKRDKEKFREKMRDREAVGGDVSDAGGPAR